MDAEFSDLDGVSTEHAHSDDEHNSVVQYLEKLSFEDSSLCDVESLLAALA